MKKSNFYLFTYGTLMSGMPRNHVLNGQKFIGEGTLSHYKMFDYVNLQYMISQYPFIIAHNKPIYNIDCDETILGEVYLCNKSLIPTLDEIEGNGYLYFREKHMVTLIDGKKIPCVVYVGNSKLFGQQRNICPLKSGEKYEFHYYKIKE